jgi:hypothetical protein
MSHGGCRDADEKMGVIVRAWISQPLAAGNRCSSTSAIDAG